MPQPSTADLACGKSFAEADFFPSSTKARHRASIGALKTRRVIGVVTSIPAGLLFLLKAHAAKRQQPLKAYAILAL